jgi:hypothetical protein
MIIHSASHLVFQIYQNQRKLKKLCVTMKLEKQKIYPIKNMRAIMMSVGKICLVIIMGSFTI